MPCPTQGEARSRPLNYDLFTTGFNSRVVAVTLTYQPVFFFSSSSFLFFYFYFFILLFIYFFVLNAHIILKAKQLGFSLKHNSLFCLCYVDIYTFSFFRCIIYFFNLDEF